MSTSAPLNNSRRAVNKSDDSKELQANLTVGAGDTIQNKAHREQAPPLEKDETKLKATLSNRTPGLEQSLELVPCLFFWTPPFPFAVSSSPVGDVTSDTLISSVATLQGSEYHAGSKRADEPAEEKREGVAMLLHPAEGGHKLLQRAKYSSVSPEQSCCVCAPLPRLLLLTGEQDTGPHGFLGSAGNTF